MPPAASALGGTPGLAPFSSAVDSLAGKPDARYNKFADSMEQATKDRDTQQSEIEKARANVDLPPAQQPIPLPEEKHTSPEKAWGSAAMTLAPFGSLFTRQHLNTALAAAAGVMNAFHKGDLEVADREFKKWQVANDNAMKMVQYQNQTYQ